MGISAAQVKELRERTGAGMMDCKKALVEADGDIDEAIKILRTKGLSAAAKKAHREASEGLVVVRGDAQKSVILELNCETDFVARTDEFRSFAEALAELALSTSAGSASDLKVQPFPGDDELTVEQAISHKVAKIGENIVLSRVAVFEAASGSHLANYVHMGGSIGVLVEGTDAIRPDVLRDVAMHIAATDPRFVTRDEVTPEVLASEREIALEQAVKQGKPEQIAKRIVEGKMAKYYEQVVLVEQPFAKDTSKTVGEYIREAGGDHAKVSRFVRFKLGEATGE